MKKTQDITLDEWMEALTVTQKPKTPPPGYYTGQEITEKLGYKYSRSGRAAERLRSLVFKGMLVSIVSMSGAKFYKPITPKERKQK